MGYDLYSIKQTSDAKLIKEFNPSWGDKLEVPNGLYCRLNIFGMGRMLDTMDDAGALSGEASPEFPKWREGMSKEEEAKHEREVRKLVARPGTVADKVPAFKFCSNDGWLVTPAECATIAEKLFGWLDVNTDEGKFVAHFARFNRACEKLGGYNVW